MDSSIGLILGASVFLLLLFIAFLGVFYFFTAFGLYRMATNRGVEHAWIAFVPVLQLYILGSIIGTLRFNDFEIPHAQLVLPLAPIVVQMVPVSGFLASLLNIALFALNILAFYNLYMMYSRKNATMLTVVSGIFPLATPFIIFSLRNNTPEDAYENTNDVEYEYE